MKRVLRPVLLCAAVTFPILALTKYLLSAATPMTGLSPSFIDCCVATYNPQNAEEVADMEMVIALAISTGLISTLRMCRPCSWKMAAHGQSLRCSNKFFSARILESYSQNGYQ